MIVDEAGSGAVRGGVAGVRNFRDAGGVGSLREGLLYRSGALRELAAGGAQSLEGLGVRTVVDLRSLPEVAAGPDALHGTGLAYVHAPVFAEQRWPDDQLELYPAMAEHAGRSAVAVLRGLIAPGGPAVLVHCASGKDRTGVVIAVIQTLLGATEAEVTGDFLRTNAELGLSAETSATTAGHGSRPVAAGHLRRALVWIRSHHGSIPAYLTAHGARPSELEALEALTRVAGPAVPPRRLPDRP
ncbi:tyrosine-protein phosphatase [Kitasatospora sp. NPDC056651]|uniref:tyrosine-protein phosphatase n=1 Tax=Kitasatospora sp. NPDC056651 TaxID=3345892 RepID=UPI0036B8FF53